MRKWMRDRIRRKKAQATSESTGRIGQPKDPGAAEALQPAYDTGQPPPPREFERPSREPQRPPREPQRPPREPQRPAREPQRSAREDRASERMQMETQPESPSQPPAAPAEATGQAPTAHKERAPRGVVVLTIGLPGSGKTTWYKRRGVTPLSSDLLRNILFDNITEQRYQGLVFSTLRSLLRARLIARMPWNYVDATNLSPRERRQWIRMARSMGYEVHAVFFDVPLEVCLERNQQRERVVPEDIMRRMAAKLKPPTFEEGFSKIIVVRVKGAS
jgi:predicted kinase